MTLSALFRMMRFHKPVGIVLLWVPTAWALWIANQGFPSPGLLLLFLAGTVIMRAAGCVMNDIADRNIDSHVKRTRSRPLASGEITLKEAIGILLFLLILAASLLLLLPVRCFYYALIALALTMLYPFCKRFIESPQLVLGLAFSMGIPMAYAASGVMIDTTVFFLLAINFGWIVAYDTQYAMVDRQDDLQIGVKSTAILFAQRDKLAIGLLQVMFHALWIPLMLSAHFFKGFIAFWLVGASSLVYQQWLIADRDEARCLRAFSSNIWYGLIMWLGIVINYYQGVSS
ncbi:4-hydroxybenzoate octaprenyltransferase [Legionella spiritensis]|uniref:4-hydroxybenzoate octaprenyltransferase n=1 Tax=Legionella spiritensis TaxID=452 RepID=UPI000F6C0CAA|nr:4-hydroxybenzoate octaprenyltransferase [Legionella spiritensis]VEG90010.1 4-hydroxybenzoate-octaprenyltransferase [Legionella spiritensis]